MQKISRRISKPARSEYAYSVLLRKDFYVLCKSRFVFRAKPDYNKSVKKSRTCAGIFSPIDSRVSKIVNFWHETRAHESVSCRKTQFSVRSESFFGRTFLLLYNSISPKAPKVKHYYVILCKMSDIFCCVCLSEVIRLKKCL